MTPSGSLTDPVSLPYGGPPRTIASSLRSADALRMAQLIVDAYTVRGVNSA